MIDYEFQLTINSIMIIDHNFIGFQSTKGFQYIKCVNIKIYQS